MAGIYLHIPFCKQACTYCNFHFSTSLKQKEEILQAMLREIEMQRNYLQGQPIETIYFGGGTPSLLTADDINRLFEQVTRFHNIEYLQEFTIEANPDDLNANYLKALRATPVDRLSIGVQSFYNSDLLYMHRAHNAQQADYAIKAAQDAGFTNLSIDLIYGTPGLNDANWKHNLSLAAALQVQHLSAYALTVEEGTVLHHDIAKKKTEPVDPIQAAAQFEILMEQTAASGYEHYEISNLALPGHHAIHNTNYWMGIPYLGIGPSAHSFNGSSRRWNVSNNALYLKNILTQNTIPFEEEHLTSTQRLNEYIMTSLRTIWGCDLDKIEKKWDSTFAKQVEKSSLPFIEKNWLTEKNRKLILTNTGKLFADKIASEMFLDNDKKH